LRFSLAVLAVHYDDIIDVEEHEDSFSDYAAWFVRDG
jgi:hypothetical protein